MRTGQLICVLICFIVFIVTVTGCAYVKKDVVVVPCVLPATVSYTTDIAPIIDANCSFCHSAASASSGILLDNYDGLKFYADNGYLYGTISHSSGYRPMPDGGAKLNDCTISIIKKWIDSGTPR
jgi:hypothetical protein